MPPFVEPACCPFAARGDSPELAQYSVSTPRWGLLKLGTFFGTAKDITPDLLAVSLRNGDRWSRQTHSEVERYVAWRSLRI